MTEHSPHYETPNEPPDSALSSADLCRRKGWQVGDVLFGIDRQFSEETAVIRITAIGENAILVVQTMNNGKPYSDPVGETEFGLEDRDWRKVNEVPYGPWSSDDPCGRRRRRGY